MLKSDSERLREIRINDGDDDDAAAADSPIGVSRLRGFLALVGVTENIRYEWRLIVVD